MFITLIILSVIFLIFFAEMIAESRFILKIRREDFGGDIRIVHIGDLHKRTFGKGNIKLIQRIIGENPDIILISGDIISRTCRDFSNVSAFLKKLSEIAPTFMVLGNHEQDLPEEFSTKFIDAVEKSGVNLLRNEVRIIEINGKKLNLCGLELERSVYKKNESYRNLDKLELTEINEKLGNKPDGETVLLVHNPFFADVYAQWGAEYSLCGHVHGGAVRIPFTGTGILSPERKLFPKFCFGVYEIGKSKILVTTGIGKLRLFNPAEIVVYKI